jgi:hypothetical protein
VFSDSNTCSPLQASRCHSSQCMHACHDLGYCMQLKPSEVYRTHINQTANGAPEYELIATSHPRPPQVRKSSSSMVATQRTHTGQRNTLYSPTVPWPRVTCVATCGGNRDHVRKQARRQQACRPQTCRPQTCRKQECRPQTCRQQECRRQACR